MRIKVLTLVTTAFLISLYFVLDLAAPESVSFEARDLHATGYFIPVSMLMSDEGDDGTPARSEDVDFANLPDDVRCLAQAVYFEARGEPFEGQLAIALVILNRVEDPRYPETVCKVVFQNEHKRHACQFSFACDGKSDRPRNPAPWKRSVRLAELVASGSLRDLTASSTHYHADYVLPDWAGAMIKTIKIGHHQFYRT